MYLANLLLFSIIAVANATPPFVITSGADACKLAASLNNDYPSCFISANYPADYDSDQTCKITLQSTGKLKVVDFVTEERWDYVKLGGKEYSGTTGPIDVAVKHGDVIEWLSDRGSNDKGFKICFVPPVVCDKQSGSVLNSADKECSCGTAICTADSGFYCNKGQHLCAKSSIPSCLKTNGASKNSASCVCGRNTNICDPSNGLYCNADKFLCAKVAVPTCNNMDGTSLNVGSCLCGKGTVDNICSSSTGFFCHGQHELCSKVDTICGPNEHVVDKKCASCALGHRRFGDDPSGDDTFCDVFVPRTRAELQAGVFGCLGKCLDLKGESRSTYCYVQGGLGEPEMRNSGVFENGHPYVEGTGEACLNANINVPVGQGIGKFGPIWSWDVSKIDDFQSLFYSAKNFNVDISRWNVVGTLNVDSINEYRNGLGTKDMFNYAYNFDQDLCGPGWNAIRDKATVNKERMFQYTGKSSAAADASAFKCCAGGQYYDRGTRTGNARGVCKLCPPGQFQKENDVKPDSCSICPRNTYTSKAGGALGCTACETGGFSKAGSTSCAICHVGYYTVRDSSTNFATGCQACTAGKYQPKQGQNKCVRLQLSILPFSFPFPFFLPLMHTNTHSFSVYVYNWQFYIFPFLSLSSFPSSTPTLLSISHLLSDSFLEKLSERISAIEARRAVLCSMLARHHKLDCWGSIVSSMSKRDVYA